MTVINNAAASIAGGDLGIFVRSGFANVTNSGSITGTDNVGIIAADNVTVTNNAGASIAGGNYGIQAFFGGGSSVFNAGTISGGIAAIQFAGTGNTLTLAQGSVITGNVLGTGRDIFQLGGTGAATFDVSSLGPAAQYQGFGTFNKVGSSVWTLTGTPGQSTSWSINGGTLSVSSDANLGSGAEAVSFNGGVMQVTGTTFTSAPRAINWGASGGGFDIADPANTFTVSQNLTGTGGLAKLGAGTLTLSDVNTYTGPTTVDAGTLMVSGLIASSSITNNSGLAFAGSSTAGSATITTNSGGSSRLQDRGH